MSFHLERGKTGEELAARFLERLGYRILAKNFKTRFGEIDLIARDGSCFVFVEVKTRSTVTHGHPSESVNAKRIERIQNAGQIYLQKQSEEDQDCRIDVVSILLSDEGGDFHVEHFPNITA